jgi:uncharacterized NAD-dependent epimerase/dehydratase family protein
MRGLPSYKLPELGLCMERNLDCARLVNPNCAFVGIAVNTSALGEGEADDLLKKISDEHGLPAVDPVRHGVEPILDHFV